MILAYTLLGKPVSDTSVTKDELCILMCVFQSRPVIGAAFMLAKMFIIARATHGPILIGGLVTRIARALSLRAPLRHLIPFGAFCSMNVIFCFNMGLIRNHDAPPYQLLVHHVPVHYFALPSPANTSVHDQKNWVYALEGEDENEPEREESDPLTPPGYHDIPAETYVVVDEPMVDHAAVIESLQTDVATLRSDMDGIRSDVVALRTDFVKFMDIATENLDFLFQHYNSRQPPKSG